MSVALATYDVFISYSHADRPWVQRWLLPQMEAAGLHACIDDRDFAIGVPSIVNMEDAVIQSRHTLIVLNPSWVTSQWTALEALLTWAMASTRPSRACATRSRGGAA